MRVGIVAFYTPIIQEGDAESGINDKCRHTRYVTHIKYAAIFYRKKNILCNFAMNNSTLNFNDTAYAYT